jgi:hypothetical protein
MKVFNIITFLFVANVCQGQTKDTVFILSCQPPEQNIETVRSDTIWRPHTNSLLIINTSTGGRLISEVTLTDTKNIEVFDYNNIKTASVKTVFYDSARHVTYESLSQNSVTYHCYTYRYDHVGRLIYKEGYSSGELGVRVQYEYNNAGRLIKETAIRPTRTSIKYY